MLAPAPEGKNNCAAKCCHMRSGTYKGNAAWAKSLPLVDLSGSSTLETTAWPKPVLFTTETGE